MHEDKEEGKNFYPFCFVQRGNTNLHQALLPFLAMQKIETPKGKEKYFSI